MATWSGSGNGTSWSDPHNWSPNTAAPNFVAVTISYPPAVPPVVVNILASQNFAAQPLTLGSSSASQNITLNNAGTFAVDGGAATLYAGTELHNTGSVTLNGGGAIFGSLVDDGSGLTMNGVVTVESGGLLQIDAGFSASENTDLVLNGTLKVNGTFTSPAAIQGNGAAIINGGNVSGGSGNPLQIGSASVAFTLLGGGTLDVTVPSGTDSFTFGAVTTVKNTLIIPSFSNTVASTISGFAAGDQIETSSSGATSIVANGGGTYTITYGSVKLTNVSLGAGVTPGQVQFSGGTISVICFAEGTRIRTIRGEVAVEDLQPGEMAETVSGEFRPIRWIGHRLIDLARHGQPDAVAPIRIRQGAIADLVPSRDLLVSPDHALYLDGVLIAARQLVNGVSITQDFGMRALRYFHVELDRHDILLAENTPAESYLDADMRMWFEEANPIMSRHFVPTEIDRRTAGCAPLATDEAIAEPIWRRLANRAANDDSAPGGMAPPTTTRDSGLRILVDGRSVAPTSTSDRRASFVLPRDSGTVVLRSRTTQPNELQPWLDDRRRLGVSIKRLTLQSDQEQRDIPLDHPALGVGWWDVERSDAAMWRWTDGDAQLALGAFAGDSHTVAVLQVEFDIAAGYPTPSGESAPATLGAVLDDH